MRWMRGMLFLVRDCHHRAEPVANDVVSAFRAFTLYPRDCLKHYSNTIVRGKDGTDLNGNRLTVQFARGTRPRDTFAAPDRTHPRPRRTAFRMQITGLPGETSWQVS